MINLEQIKLLETKVARAIDYVDHLAKENAVLHQQEADLRRQEAELQAKLESYQKRIDELEVLVTGFREDQDRIEEGILSALDRLSQFEKAMEKTLRDKPAKTAAAASAKRAGAVKETGAAKSQAAEAAPETAAAADNSGPGEGQTCFEIPEAALGADAAEDDIPDPLNTSGELDIF